MTNENRYPHIVLGLLVSGFLFAGCSNKAAQQGFERPPAPVSVSAAVAQDVPTYLDAIGKTQDAGDPPATAAE